MSPRHIIVLPVGDVVYAWHLDQTWRLPGAGLKRFFTRQMAEHWVTRLEAQFPQLDGIEVKTI